MDGEKVENVLAKYTYTGLGMWAKDVAVMSKADDKW